MGTISDKTFCAIVCLGVASLAGFGAMWALLALGTWTFLQALFAAGVIWAVLSVMLLLIICGTGGETQAEARTRLEAEMQAKRDAMAAVTPAPTSMPAPAPKKNAPPAKAAAPKTAAPATTPTAKAPLAPATVAPTEAPTAAPTTEGGTRPEALAAARDGKADDLKQIKGVGPAMEKLCNSLGFYHFDQIAGWTPDEVAWVDQNLEGFKGRVTRDDWVAQAKLLAAGGETEFSKRVEDGDVY